MSVYADGGMECKKAADVNEVRQVYRQHSGRHGLSGRLHRRPAVIEPPMVAKGRMAKENNGQQKTIEESLESFDFTGVPMHRK